MNYSKEDLRKALEHVKQEIETTDDWDKDNEGFRATQVLVAFGEEALGTSLETPTTVAAMLDELQESAAMIRTQVRSVRAHQLLVREALQRAYNMSQDAHNMPGLVPEARAVAAYEMLAPAVELALRYLVGFTEKEKTDELERKEDGTTVPG